MTKPTIQIGEEVREMTDAEYKQHQKDQAAFAKEAEEIAARVALKEATLKKLGLSADEIAALLS
jgi:phosphopantetheinyl transferase (holo-ACP synthase)